jgi:molybdopterin/thiamine biosynthesis adenylyltransferase
MTNYSRQSSIFNPDNQKSKIIIIGAGSTGSFLTLTLAKLGFKDITVIDNDIVEESNIPHQLYGKVYINQLKVDALKQMILDLTDITINAVPKIVDEAFEFEITPDTIVINCVDSMDARILVYNKLKDCPIKLIDCRFGAEGYAIYSLDFGELNTDGKQTNYEKSLKLQTQDLPCGEKAICFAVLSLSSEVSNIVKRMDKGEHYPFVIKRHMGSYMILTDENGK